MSTGTPDVDLTDVDLFVEGRHHQVFAELRLHQPVYRNRAPGSPEFWALTRYRDVAAAYQDQTSFSSSGGAMLGGSFRSEVDTASGRMLVASDPPRHRLLRHVMHQVFSPHNLNDAADRIRRLVRRSIQRLAADGGGDFATDVSVQLPTGALMSLLGVAEQEAHHLIGLTRQMIGYRDPGLVDDSVPERVRLAGVQVEIFDFFADLLRDRRRRGASADGLIGVLLRARVNGSPLPEDDILYNCMNVAVGGNETSSYTACSGMLRFIRHPEQLRLLADRPELMDSAVNEVLRWGSTNSYVQRVAVRDVTVGGELIRAGETVTLWNVSANRDEEQFPDAHVFDITRHPNRHLSYGHGPHRCIGAQLAHAELSILWEELAAAGLHLALAGEVRRLRSNFILGITELPVAVASGRPALPERRGADGAA